MSYQNIKTACAITNNHVNLTRVTVALEYYINLISCKAMTTDYALISHVLQYIVPIIGTTTIESGTNELYLWFGKI